MGKNLMKKLKTRAVGLILLLLVAIINIGQTRKNKHGDAKRNDVLYSRWDKRYSKTLGDFYDVIDRVSILTSDKEKNIVTLETNGNMLVLRSSSAEIGRVEEKMPITKNNEEDIKISFSAKYMMEALKSFSTETVDIHFVGEIKPILIKSTEDETLTQLVLPIRTY